MAIYALGDIQGCYSPMLDLLDEIGFNQNDQLWFTGDLVNRGQYSLETLRFIKNLGEQAICVLGNHDISLLAFYYGLLEKDNPDLQRIIDAPDADELITWLKQRPLLYADESLHLAMCHAGISPLWDWQTAQQCAHEVEQALQQENIVEWLTQVYGDKPRLWSDELSGHKRHRYIINAFTRMRYCKRNGKLSLKEKLSPDETIREDKELYPWFKTPNRKPLGMDVIFGHWSTLGFQQETVQGDTIISTDTGCVWGGRLTAVRVDSELKQAYSIQCNDYGR